MIENKNYEIQIEIENACMLNCVHCSSYEMRQSIKRLYSEETIIDFILCFPNSTNIYFTGGDPILYPGLINLCEQITFCKKNTCIGLYTTGNTAMMKPISEEYAICMANAGIKDCYLSIYHSIPEEHDDFTNCPGSFQNTILSVKNLKFAGIDTKAHLVLTKQNYKHLDNIINFCQEVGFVEVRVLKLTCSGNAVNNWDKIGVPSQLQDEIIKSLILRSNEFNVKLSFSGYPHLHPCRSITNAYRCQAGTNLLYITLSGDVYPCACTVRNAEQYKLGNINNLNEIFNKIYKLYPNSYNNFCLNQ